MTQPRITPSQVEVAEARRTTLPNGIGLYTLASDDFEVLRISFVFRAGSALQQAPFSASAAANLLSEGSRDMTAHQIAATTPTSISPPSRNSSTRRSP